ncbi:MAG: hypothetical protein ACRD2E_15480 [Terriglobales bacterium]
MALLFAAVASLAAWGARPRLRRFGNITFLPLAQELAAPNPAPAVAQINFRDFTFRLYPTQDAPDPGHSGIAPFAAAGQPLVLQVRGGHFDDRENAAAPLEFDIIRTSIATLPHVLNPQLAVVFGILYTGEDRPTCTGVVQTFATYQHRVWLMAQFTYNCQGGMNARYVARKHQLRIRSAVFAAGDRRCCPTLQDAVNFKMDGPRVKPSGVALAPGS